MARYRTQISANRDLPDAFAYLSRFDSAAEWDPGIASARMLTADPVRIGSRFELVAKFAGRRIPLEYEIIEFEKNQRVVLRAENASIRSLDTITFHQDGSDNAGTLVIYDAVLEAKRARRLLDPVLKLVFRRMGDRATAGLRRVLSEPSR